MHTNTQHIFLDLEGTLIDAWDSARPMMTEIKAIRNRLKVQKISTVQIFSFAIHHERDQDWFKRTMQADLEQRLGVTISRVISMVEMKAADEKFRGCRLDDLTELTLLRGKEGAFESWASLMHRGDQSTLIDDVVVNRSIHNHDTDTHIEFTNIQKIVNLWDIWREQA
jgi:hypothetical protein